MGSILDKEIVLVLNKSWQAIGVSTPRKVMGQLAADANTALNCAGGNMTPTRWADWVKLPVGENDNYLGTPHQRVRVPTVVVLSSYNKMPMKAPKLSARTLWERDQGTCQYTGRKLTRGEGNMDHVVPVSRGGQNTWENVVLADKKINTKKGAQLPAEAGLKLLKTPKAPKQAPAAAFIRNANKIKDWDMFLP
jgi:5-methylcytosine-specific restriction endonuclease McrA